MEAVWSPVVVSHRGSVSSPATIMTSIQALREFIDERLTAAAAEIFTAFQQTIVQFEKEIHRQRKLLQISSKHQSKLPRHRTGSPEQHIDKQKMSSIQEQEEHEAPHVKELTVADGECDTSHDSVRDLTTQRLTAAAVEIFTVFEEAIVRCEEEIDRQHRLLEIIWKPQIKLHKTELRRHHGRREEQLFKQETNCCPEQGEPEAPHVMKEQEESGLLQKKKDQQQPEPPQVREKQEEPGLIPLKKGRKEPQPPQIREKQEEPGLLQIKEEPEEVELSQIREEQEQPGLVQCKKDPEEPEPSQTVEEQLEPGLLCIKEEKEEPDLSQTDQRVELGSSQKGEQLVLKVERDTFKTALPTCPAPLCYQGGASEPPQGRAPAVRRSLQEEQGHRAPGPSSWHKPPGSDQQRPSSSPWIADPSLTLCYPYKCVDLPDSSFFYNLKPVGLLNGQLLYMGGSAAAPPVNTSSSLKRQHEDQVNDNKPYIKKPPNAFMLFLKEQRPVVSAEIGVKESAIVNAEVGKRWNSLPKHEKDRYYLQAKVEAKLHEEQHPGWSTIENYRKSKARRRAARTNASGFTGRTKMPQAFVSPQKDDKLNPYQAVHLLTPEPQQPATFQNK